MRGWPKLGQRWGPQSLRLRARVSAAQQASSSSMESGDCPSPAAYWWCLNVHVSRPNVSTRPVHVQPNFFFFAILLHPYPYRGRVLDITPKICCRHCYKTLPYLTINTTSSKKLTSQADQEPEQYRSGHDWYSKLIRLEHEHRLLKFWTEYSALHYGDLWASKKQETWINCSPSETRPWRHGTMNRQ